MKLKSTSVLHSLRALSMIFVVAMLSTITFSCDHSELWSDVPGKITKFINQYYPNAELQSVSHTGTTYHIRIDDGPGLTFDADYNWTDINGYGMPVPQVLLFDQLPPKLYNYLQGTQQLNAVFSISRDNNIYTVALLDSTLTFNADNEELTGSNATKAPAS